MNMFEIIHEQINIRFYRKSSISSRKSERRDGWRSSKGCLEKLRLRLGPNNKHTGKKKESPPGC